MKARLAAAGLTHGADHRPGRRRGARTGSARVAQARSRARERGDAQRQALWPLGWAFIAVVVTATSRPIPRRGCGCRPGRDSCARRVRGSGRDRGHARWARRGLAAQAVVIGLIGGAGVALAALQPHGPAELAAPGSLDRRGPAAAGPGRRRAGSDHGRAGPGHHDHRRVPAAQRITATLVCLLLAVTGQFIRRGRESQDRTELLHGPAAGRARGRGRRGRAGRAQPHRRRAARRARPLAVRPGHPAAGRPQAGRPRTGQRWPARHDRAVGRTGQGRTGRRAAGRRRAARRPAAHPGPAGSLVEGFRRDTGTAATLRIDGTAGRCPPRPAWRCSAAPRRR